MDHTVFVDGRRRLVYDNEEEYPIELNPDSLRFCSGVKTRAMGVRVRAMEMVTQLEKVG